MSKYPVGYMPYLIGIAAGKVASLLLDNMLFEEHLGSIWAINLWTRDVSLSRFVERHGCSNCGTQDQNRTIGALAAYCRSREESKLNGN
jgi:hypothetical protein